MPKCCKCRKPANVLGDDGLTPYCYWEDTTQNEKETNNNSQQKIYDTLPKDSSADTPRGSQSVEGAKK